MHDTHAASPDANSADGLPLSGILIADFSRLLPGPWCAQMLSDFGATVIKVEQRGVGDPSRFNPPRYRSASVYYRSVNANKQALTLDLSKPDGVAVAHRLLRRADIMLESFRTSVSAKLGIDYPMVRAFNPALIYCAISGFGQTGPLAHIPGHDLVVQAMAGILRPPERGQTFTLPPFQAADYAAAAMACIGIMAALRNRDRTGEGCYLDMSMFDSLIQMGNISLLPGLSILAGGTGEPALEAWGANPRYSIYPTRDGRHVAVCLLEAKLWGAFCRAIDRADLISADEGPEQRHSNHGMRSELYRTAIAQHCLRRDRDALVADMCALGIPILPVLSPAETLSSEHVRARDLAGVCDDAREGQVTELRNPFRASGLARSARRAAPEMGEDSAAVLAVLGYSQQEIDQMIAGGVI